MRKTMQERGMEEEVMGGERQEETEDTDMGHVPKVYILDLCQSDLASPIVRPKAQYPLLHVRVCASYVSPK